MATKTAEEKLTTKLEKMGVDTLTGKETLVELETLLAEKEKEAEAAKPKKATKTAVSVEYHGGVREFSKDIHGDDFEDVAAQFAETHKGTIL